MQTYTVSSSGTASSGGTSFPIPATDTTSTVKRTYVARQSVTAPAGPFETCHFEDDVPVSAATPTTDLTVTPGSTLPTQVISGGDDTEQLRTHLPPTPTNQPHPCLITHRS